MVVRRGSVLQRRHPHRHRRVVRQPSAGGSSRRRVGQPAPRRRPGRPAQARPRRAAHAAQARQPVPVLRRRPHAPSTATARAAPPARHARTRTSPARRRADARRTPRRHRVVRQPPRRTPAACGGTEAVWKKTPEVIARLEALMTHETGRRPGERAEVDAPYDRQDRRRTGRVRYRRLCANRRAALKAWASPLRVNHKKLAGTSHPNRDDQFQRITALRERCTAESTPVISVDTKKKELVGAFKNAGAKWDRAPELVKDHDFLPRPRAAPSPTDLRPAGQYRHGLSSALPPTPRRLPSTASRNGGAPRVASAYPRAAALQILADSGGSNGCPAAGLEVQPAAPPCNAMDCA